MKEVLRPIDNNLQSGDPPGFMESCVQSINNVEVQNSDQPDSDCSKTGWWVGLYCLVGP